MESSRPTALLLMLAAAFLFSVMSALAKHAASGMSSAQVVFFRSLTAAAVLAAFHLLRYRGESILGTNRPLLLLRGVFGALALMLFFYSLTGLAVADALLINQTAPVFVLPLARIFLGEPVRKAQVALVPVTMLGVVLVLEPTFHVASLHGIAAFLSAILSAGAYVCIRKITRQEHAHVVILYFAIAAVLVSAPQTVMHFTPPSALLWLVLVAIGVFSVIAQAAMTVAYRFDRAGRVAMAGTMGPVFAGVMDAVFWNRFPGVQTLVGAAIVIGSLLALEFFRRQQD
ncbi:MAG: DMT family transporter [Deltaproteobacteria bacterium]|nr:MAG: DMT family transporter [Deltaproteobacteria bacterium]